MRLLILYISLIVIAGCSSISPLEVSKNNQELIRTPQGLLQYQGIPFSGHVVEFYENGQTKSNTGYSQGLRERTTFGYYATGELKSKRDYTKGEKTGTHKGYFIGGEKRFEYTFQNGENVGTHYEWFVDGSLLMESNYQNGQPFGSQKVWRSDGKLRSNYVIREDGRKYGLVGIKRCKNIDIEEEQVKPLTVAVYEK